MSAVSGAGALGPGGVRSRRAGSRTVNVVPRAGSLTTSMSPPHPVTIVWQTEILGRVWFTRAW